MPISVQAHPLTQQECDTFDKVLREDPQYREKLASALSTGDQGGRQTWPNQGMRFR